MDGSIPVIYSVNYLRAPALWRMSRLPDDIHRVLVDELEGLPVQIGEDTLRQTTVLKRIKEINGKKSSPTP
jgi:hypothetical protein